MSSIDSQVESQVESQFKFAPISNSTSPPKRNRSDSPPPIAPGTAVIIDRTDEVLFGRVVSLDANGIYTIDVSGELAVASERNVRPARFSTQGNQIFFRCQIDCGDKVAELICTGVSTKKMTVLSRHPVFAGAVLCADDCDRCEIMHVVSVEERDAVAACEEKRRHALERIEELAGVDAAKQEEIVADSLAAASLRDRPKWQVEPVDKRVDKSGSRVAAANAARKAKEESRKATVAMLPGMGGDEDEETGVGGVAGVVDSAAMATFLPAGQSVESHKSPLEKQVAILRDCTEKILRAKWGDFSWVELPKI